MSENFTITVDNGVTTIRFAAAPTYQEVQQVIAEIAAKYPYEIRLWGEGLQDDRGSDALDRGQPYTRGPGIDRPLNLPQYSVSPSS
jgi:hypothetical protein